MTDMSLPPAPSPAFVLEASLYAQDIETAREFYGTVLGLTQIAHVEGRHVFYRVGPGMLLIFNPHATAQSSPDPAMPVPGHGAHGPGHLCLSATQAELDAWRARLIAAGHEIEADFRWPNGARSIYIRDPFENSLEFAEPRLWD
jgi:catechol 2,3-dioxygenase-like lactoylglutathione lyase family enzyme